MGTEVPSGVPAPLACTDGIEQRLEPLIRLRGEGRRTFTLRERMRLYRVPGVSVAVVEDGAVRWARGFGVVEAGSDRRVTETTLFQAASMSKPVAAVAALRLVEAGQLSLDSAVRSRLISWKIPDHPWAERKPVTLAQLLSHSAGFTVHGFGGYAADEPVPSIVQVLDGAPPANSPPVRVDVEPGTQWRYSGGGYTIVQLLMTDVTGRSFPQLGHDLVLSPLGMGHSTFDQPLPKAERSRAATGHLTGGKPVEGRYHTYPEMAAAGLWTTPSDLGRFIIGVARAARGEAWSILPKPLADRMLTEAFGRWGLGLQIQGREPNLRFSHAGANEGFRGEFVGYRDRSRGAAVMTNSDDGLALARELLMTIARSCSWPGFEGPVEKDPIVMAPDVLRRFEGRYRLSQDSTQVVSVRLAGNTLTARLPWGPTVGLVPVTDTTFVMKDLGIEWRFRGADTLPASSLTAPLFGRAVRVR